MRTGAIFARGSCRALKWTALLGVVFALGAGQAAAQEDKNVSISSATIENVGDNYSKRTIRVTMSEAVWGPTPARYFSNGITNVANGISGLAPASPGRTTFILTFPGDVVISTGLTYTRPTTVADRLLAKDATENGTTPDWVATIADATITEADTAPRFSDDVDGKTYGPFPPGAEIAAFSLPKVIEGSGLGVGITYAVDDTTLPPGLLYTANADGVTGHEGDNDRVISGTPSTAGTYEVTYTATDLAAGRTPNASKTDTAKFNIQIGTTAPPPPPTGTGRAMFTSAVVKGGDSRTVVVSVSGQGVRLLAPGTLESIEDAFKLSTNNTVASVSGLSASLTQLAAEFEITFTTNLNGREWLYYTPPGIGGLVDGEGAIASQEVQVDPVTPQLGYQMDLVVQAGESYSYPLDREEYGGKKPVTYELRNELIGGGEGTVVTRSTESINTTVGGVAKNSGLYFDAATRTIMGRALDVADYPVIYTATAASNASVSAAEDQVHFYVRVVPYSAPPLNTDGSVTKITVGDADPAKQPTKTIGGKKRIHLAEGELSEVFVTVQWSHNQLTELWRGRTKATPPPAAKVGIQVFSVIDPATWLSPAETDERPGLLNLSGKDVVLATSVVTVNVPDAPKTNVNSVAHFGSKTGKTTLSLPHDIDAEEEAFSIGVVTAGTFGVNMGSGQGARSSDIVVIEDDETQGITLSRDPASTAPVLEGGNHVTFKAVAKPPREDLELQVRYNVTDSKGVSVSSQLYTLTGSVGSIPVGATAKDNVTFTTPANDGDREDIDLKVHAEVVSFSLGSGAFDDVQSDTVDITVLDVHKLPMLLRNTVKPMTAEVDEDGEIELTMQIDRNPANTIRRSSEGQEYTSEPVTVMFSMGAGSTVSGADYEIMGNPVKVDEHNGRAPWTQDVKVTIKASADQALDDMEMLVLDVVIDGTENAKYGSNTDDDTYRGVATLTIKEGTAKLVWAKTQAEVEAAIDAAKAAGMGTDDMLTAGEMIKVKGSDLFGAGQGVTLSFSAETSDATVASYMVNGGDVTVTAEGKGDAMITIKAHASMPSGVTINQQTDTREASITFPVSVALEPLAITLEGPDAGMHLVEGMEYTLTAKANRAVEMDTMVELVQTGGSASPADYEVAAITISAGESMGTTKLMVKEDDMDEHGGGMEESLTLEGRVGTMKTEPLTFYLWDQAVPALPVIAQLLLAAFLAVGGYRRYRRR